VRLALAAIMRLVFATWTAFSLIFAGVLGALVGSFANVVIFRVPAGRSIVFPGSSCPNCGYRLQPLDLVPIFSWLALGRRCRKCRMPISARYPSIELLMAVGFVVLVWRFPILLFGSSVLPLLALYAMLVMMSMIDIDHYLLPDSLTLPALVVGVLGAFLYEPMSGLPTVSEALFGAMFAAGCLALINRIGSLVMRRFQDTQERLFPIGMDHVNIAALFGALAGVWVGVGVAVVSVMVNIITKRTVRLPEPLLYGLWLLAIILLIWQPLVSLQTGLLGTAAAAGALSILGAAYWWGMELAGKVEPVDRVSANQTETHTTDATTPPSSERDVPPESDIDTADMTDTTDTTDPAADEPIAMGFGDVKLAAVLGAFLGWELALVALFLSFIIGAIGGIISRIVAGSKLIPFGPYLAISGLLSLFIGQPLLAWYLNLLGF
jgi:leader peptidase (prepilin peptidase) / N-methyltransferase